MFQVALSLVGGRGWHSTHRLHGEQLALDSGSHTPPFGTLSPSVTVDRAVTLWLNFTPVLNRNLQEAPLCWSWALSPES